MKYNYVLLSTDWDVYRQFYSDVLHRDDVCYVAGPQASKRGLEKLLYRAHFNKKLNRLVQLPFKGLWNRSYFTNPFKNDKPLCFVLFRDWVSLDAYTGYISWLKKHYPNSRFVWFLHDLMATHVDFYTGRTLDIDRCKRDLDLVVSCNPTEAAKYQLFYHSVPLSKLCGDGNGDRCDVLFIGKDKGRMERLLRIYDALTQKGGRCRFFISEVSNPDLAGSGREGITFLDRPMSYKDCQSWISGSKCLLELRYDPVAGPTMRVSEALLFGKKLITDNPVWADGAGFDPALIRVLGPGDDTERIDLPFMTAVPDIPPHTREAVRRRLSPATFLEELDAILP